MLVCLPTTLLTKDLRREGTEAISEYLRPPSPQPPTEKNYLSVQILTAKTRFSITLRNYLPTGNNVIHKLYSVNLIIFSFKFILPLVSDSDIFPLKQRISYSRLGQYLSDYKMQVNVHKNLYAHFTILPLDQGRESPT